MTVNLPLEFRTWPTAGSDHDCPGALLGGRRRAADVAHTSPDDGAELVVLPWAVTVGTVRWIVWSNLVVRGKLHWATCLAGSENA